MMSENFDGMRKFVFVVSFFIFTHWSLGQSVVPFIRYDLTTGSNGLPMSFMGKLSLGGYLNPETVAKAETQIKDENRAGFTQSISLCIYPMKQRFIGNLGSEMALNGSSSVGEIGGAKTNKVAISSVSLRSSQMMGTKFTKDAYRAIFRGNGYFKGQTLNLGKNELTYLGVNYVDFGFQQQKPKATQWTVSLGLVSEYTRVVTRDLSLYTSVLADTVAVDGKFYSQSTQGLGWGQKGLAAVFSMSKILVYKGLQQLNNIEHLKLLYNEGRSIVRYHYFQFGVRDLGLIYLPTVKVNSRGYIWDANTSGLKPADIGTTKRVVLQQVNLTPQDLQFGNWLTQQRDTVVDRLNILQQNRRGLIISPFTIYGNTVLKNWKGGAFILNATYLNMPGFCLASTISWSKLLLSRGPQKWKSLQVEPSLTIGGFDTWNLNFFGGLTTVIQRVGEVHFMLNIRGVESWIAPSKQHGAGLSFAIATII